MTLPPLSVASRETLRETNWDLVVVGLGVTGLSVALGAARRGWRVLGLDAGDIGSGATSTSTRLWHGGIRYLDDGAEQMVREGLIARSRWYGAFPWAATWRQFHGLASTPVEASQWRRRADKYAQLSVDSVPPSEWIDAEAAIPSIGGLHGWRGVGAATFSEITFSEHRIIPTLARQAIAAGASIATDAPVLHAAWRDGGWRLPVTSVHGGTDTISAARVVLATGATTPQWAVDFGVPPLVPHWGTHLMIDRTRWPLRRAISWHHPEDGRLLYAYPADAHAVLVGTTSTTDENPLRDQAYLLRALNSLATREGVEDSAVLRVWSGARPLLADSANAAARDMRVVAPVMGLVAAQGGKWTTSPSLAAQALRALDESIDWNDLTWPLPQATVSAPRPEDLSVGTWTRWLRTFGPEAAAVAESARSRLGGLHRLGSHDILAAEVWYVQAMEAASTPERVAARLDFWHAPDLLAEIGVVPGLQSALLPG